jgi:NADH:ubiquinone oxidoreductase subunit D
MSRSTGIKRDLRLNLKETYSNYYYLNFRSYIGQHGDSYDRYLIRMNEMSESLNIITQCIQKLQKVTKFENKKKSINTLNIINFLNKNNQNINLNKNEYNSMESLINYFKT